MKNPFLKKFQKEKRWVNYRLVKVNGKNAFTKVPYTFEGYKASSTNPKDWTTYENIKKVSEDVGIVFTPKMDLLGIDIDHCLVDNKIEHAEKEKIADLILEADTYTEVSPSGSGLHLFLSISDVGGLELTGNKKAPFEIYTAGRYFTFTGNVYGEEREVRTVTKEEALKILSIIGYPWKVEEEDHEKTNLGAPEEFDLTDRTKKMYASKSGDAIRRLYDGDISAYGDDQSRADAAFLSHLSFWFNNDPVIMNEYWLRSPLGSRKKTQKRQDYRERSIKNAIANNKEVYTPSTKMPIPEELDFITVTKGKNQIIVLQNTENVCRILRKHALFIKGFRYDIFRNVFEINDGDKWRPLEDNDAVNIQTSISILFPDWFGKVGKDMVYDAVVKVSKENTYDSAADYIKAQVWDKVSRVDSWLSSTYGAPDDVYHRAVGANWLKGLVKRIVQPGCKFDYVLVLEGKQGSKKSTSLGVLGGDWHVETTMSTDSKDFFMQFQGKAIIEFSEGETLNRTEVKKMKAIITTQSDKYRPPYERVSQDFPRRCVFAMTTNQEEYLKDETGNRRWLPVTLVKDEADVEWLAANRDQLFAEAYYRLTELKESVHEFPRQETLDEQRKRQIQDSLSNTIADWYEGKVSEGDKMNGITIERVYAEVFNGATSNKPMGRMDEMQIANVLRNGLNLSKKQTMYKGIRRNRWFDPNFVLSEMSPMEREQEKFEKEGW
jgi:predicted P-loop ATPase